MNLAVLQMNRTITVKERKQRINPNNSEYNMYIIGTQAKDRKNYSLLKAFFFPIVSDRNSGTTLYWESNFSVLKKKFTNLEKEIRMDSVILDRNCYMEIDI